MHCATTCTCRNSLALANHLAVRDHLRAHPDVAHEYGELKKRLARQFTHDIDAYTEGKTGRSFGFSRWQDSRLVN